MEHAQLGLRRSCLALTAVVYGLMLLAVRGELAVEVPDRVGERGELRGKQQKRAGKMQKDASHPGDSTPAVKSPRNSAAALSRVLRPASAR